jgi:hypothetical protein
MVPIRTCEAGEAVTSDGETRRSRSWTPGLRRGTRSDSAGARGRRRPVRFGERRRPRRALTEASPTKGTKDVNCGGHQFTRALRNPHKIACRLDAIATGATSVTAGNDLAVRRASSSSTRMAGARVCACAGGSAQNAQAQLNPIGGSTPLAKAESDNSFAAPDGT